MKKILNNLEDFTKQSHTQTFPTHSHSPGTHAKKKKKKKMY